MNAPKGFPLHRLVLIMLVGLGATNSGLAQTTVASDPVGFTTTSALSSSDTYVGIPFTRPSEFSGTVASVSGSPANSITVNGSPAWSNNQFVYATSTHKTYYVLIGSGGTTNPKEGHVFTVTGNGSNSLTLDTTSDDLSGVVANTQLTIIPYWTPVSVFPPSDANVSFTPTASSSAYQTQLRIPAVATAGAYSYPTTYFYSNNVDGTTNNVGWRVAGDNTTDHGDDILLPDTYLAVRNDNGAPTLPITALGPVLTKRLSAPFFTSSTQSLDNPVTMIRPIDVSLNQSGLGPADRSFVRGDQLLLFTSNTISGGQSAAATYTYDHAWRILGDTTTDHGSDLIPAGTAMLVRKAIATSGTAFWVNSPTYVSGFSIRPVQLGSRLTHTGAGTFDADLYTVGNVGVEPRQGGTNGKDFTLVATFPLPLTTAPGVNPPTSSDGQATADTLTFANVNGRGVVTVNVHNVANIQTLSTTLTGVTDGSNSGSVTIPMGVLLGDVVESARVDGTDVSAIRQQNFQVVNDNPGTSNFRADVNLSGRIDGTDVSIARQQNFTRLP